MNEISLNGINFECHHSLYQAKKGELLASIYSILGKSFHVEIKNLNTGGGMLYERFQDKDKAFQFAADCLNKNN